MREAPLVTPRDELAGHTIKPTSHIAVLPNSEGPPAGHTHPEVLDTVLAHDAAESHCPYDILGTSNIPASDSMGRTQ